MVPDGSSNAKGTTAVRIQCCVRSVASLGIDLQNNLMDKPSAEREREREVDEATRPSSAGRRCMSALMVPGAVGLTNPSLAEPSDRSQRVQARAVSTCPCSEQASVLTLARRGT